jgi:nitric oxide reductase large subunit
MESAANGFGNQGLSYLELGRFWQIGFFIGLVFWSALVMRGTLFSEKLGLIAFWLYNAGLVLWIALNFFPVGWPQLDAVYERGLAYARSLEFYDTTVLWQWLRFVGDVPFAIAALLMAFDFIVKLGPMFPALTERLTSRYRASPAE